MREDERCSKKKKRGQRYKCVFQMLSAAFVIKTHMKTTRNCIDIECETCRKLNSNRSVLSAVDFASFTSHCVFICKRIPFDAA